MNDGYGSIFVDRLRQRISLAHLWRHLWEDEMAGQLCSTLERLFARAREPPRVFGDSKSILPIIFCIYMTSLVLFILLPSLMLRGFPGLCCARDTTVEQMRGKQRQLSGKYHPKIVDLS